MLCKQLFPLDLLAKLNSETIHADLTDSCVSRSRSWISAALARPNITGRGDGGGRCAP